MIGGFFPFVPASPILPRQRTAQNSAVLAVNGDLIRDLGEPWDTRFVTDDLGVNKRGENDCELVHTLWADDSGDLENNPEFLATVARAHYLAARLLGALADNPDSLRAEADREFMAAARCSQKAEQLTARLQEALDRVERVRVAPGREPDGS